MITYLYFIFRYNFSLITLCLLSILLLKLDYLKIEAVPIFLILFFLYNFNVKEKITKNWDYFRSLNFNFKSQSLIKIIFPFIFTLFVIVIVNSTDYEIYLLKWKIKDAMLFSSIVILASIVASGPGKFLLISCFAFIFSAIFKSSYNLEYLFIFLALGAAVFYFANGRISFKRIAFLSLMISFPFILLSHFTETPMQRFFLEKGSFNSRLLAAKQLFKKENYEGRQFLEETVKNIPERQILREILEIFEGSEFGLKVEPENWDKLFNIDEEYREIILEYFQEDVKKYPFIDLQKLNLWETAVFSGKDKCEGDCEQLAELEKKFIMEVDWQHIKKLIQSGEGDKIFFALEIIKEAGKPVLKEELLGLLIDKEKEIRKISFEILSKWMTANIDGDLLKIDFNYNNLTSKEGIEKIKIFFREKLK